MSAWGLPPDAVAWSAVIAASITLFIPRTESRFRELLLAPSPRGFVLGVAAVSALLSWGYVHFYLVGGPRIIDATSYALSAKVFALGQLSLPVDGPLGSFHGRFSFATAQRELTPLFPPGYPLALAATTLVGAPLLLGPLLAVALVGVTYALTRRLFDDELGARVAAIASALCAVLRYHTADAMSHGLAALLFALVVLWSWQRERAGPLLLAGLALGWLFATRPVTGMVAGAVALACIGPRPRRWSLLASTAWIGVLGFLLHQRALTGDWSTLVQHAYYARADGPPGCVALGFGSEVGCRGEHAEFIARYMPEGYGALQAITTTGRRLVAHLSDALNVELGAALLVAAVMVGRQRHAVRVVTFGIALQLCAYALFYFDGNYPGGGARMFADVLVFEHALIASVLVHWRASRWLAPLMLLGFGLHTSHGHVALSQRDGGRPMYEAALVPGDARLLFMDTDHGFNLASADAPPNRVVARLRKDGFDRALWEHLGKPRSYAYDFDLEGLRAPRVRAYEPEGPLRFDGSSLWPVLDISGGWVGRASSAPNCDRPGPWLVLHPTHEAKDSPTLQRGLRARIELWVPDAGEYQLVVRSDGSLRVMGAVEVHTLAKGECTTATSQSVKLASGALPLVLYADVEVAVESFSLVPSPTANP